MREWDVISPLDGRYQEQLAALREQAGPAAFARARVRAEVCWLLTLAELKLPGFRPLPAKEKALLEKLPALTDADLQILHDIEKRGRNGRPATNHDVKAVEYFISDKLAENGFASRAAWVHFALTSEDINSLAYAQILSDALGRVIVPALEDVRKELNARARKYARGVMLARTHGQPAVPTTFGKELKVFESRLVRQLEQLKKQEISCKAGGAVGSYNAHMAAFAQVNWPRAARRLAGRLSKGRKNKLFVSPVSTQVDNRDSYAELFDALRRTNVILLGLCQDMWRYISAGLVKQKTVAGEVGSSTMPQKVNPIDFENAEGNLGLANALLTFFSEKLPLSRLQRDLSDSTVLRNMAVGLGHCLLAYQSLLKGLRKTDFDARAARAELEAHPEVLAEAYQTVLRAAGVEGAYEKLKAFTRGRAVTAEDLKTFIHSLNTDEKTKQKLLALDVCSYTGLAPRQAGGKV